MKNKKVSAPVEIFADSKYVITGINEWIHNWMKNNWRTASNKPVLNQELWQETTANLPAAGDPKCLGIFFNWRRVGLRKRDN